MTINPEEILLRPWHPNDLQPLIRHANNKNISDRLTDAFPSPYNEEEAKKWISCSIEGPRRQLAIVYRTEAIGNIGVNIQQDIYRKTGEIGYWIGENFWGKGLMTEALIQFTRLCFETYKLHRIYARVCTENISSRKVLEKAGYRFQCTLEKEVIKNGKISDVWLYDKVC